MNEKECNCERCGYCCTEMEIKILDLAHPETLLGEKGLEFYKIHGLDKVLKENGTVRILHTCQFLKDGNVCSIEENKPDFCKEWSCRRHLRDSEWFKHQEGELALKAMMKVADVYKRKGYGLNSDTNHEISQITKNFICASRKLKGGI